MLRAQLPASSLVVARTKNVVPGAWQMTPNRIDRLEFNLSTGNYRQLIDQIRTQLQARDAPTYSHNRPVLPTRHQVAPRDWLDLVLSNGRRTVTLRIRQDNLYLDGFQTENGQWLEFGRVGDPQLIPGSTFLGFYGNYDGLQRASGSSIEGMGVSRSGVLNAIDGLASQNTSGRDRARYLSLMIILLCEATRFDDMSSRFGNVMRSGSTTSEWIEGWMMDLFTSWGDLSGRLLRADVDGDQYFRLPSDSPLRQRIQNALQAATYVGLLLGELVLNSASLRGFANNSLRDGATYVPPGQPMLEVSAFEISDFSADLSGKITVTDGLGQQTLFDGRQWVSPGATLSLKLLQRAISMWESVVISYNLTSADQQYVFNGSVSWDIFQINTPYSVKGTNFAPVTLLQAIKSTNNRSRSGDDGTINICGAIFPDAWQVLWVVKIDSGDGYNPMNIYGSVTASYSYNGSQYEIQLFSRSSDNNAEVYEGGNLPLLRYATAVAYDVDVTVTMKLWDYIHVLPDICIADGQGTCHIGDGGTSPKAQAGHSNYQLNFAASRSNSQVSAHLYCYRVSQTDN